MPAGTAGAPARRPSRACAGCSAPAHYLVPVRAGGGRRDPDAAPGAARRAAVPLRRDLPVPRRHARRCRPARSASGRAACGRTGGTRSGSRPAAGWWGRRSTGASRRWPARRRAHPRDLPVHRGRAAADRRVGRGRDQVHVGLGVLDHARAAHGRGHARARGRVRASTTSRRSSAPRACASTAPGGDRGAARVRDAQAQAGGQEEARPRTRASGRARSATRTCTAASAARAEPELELEPEPEPEPEIEAVPELERLAEDPARTRTASRAARPSRSIPSSSRRRAATAREVTDSPDFVWELPDAGEAHALDRGRRRARTPPARRRSPRS